MCVSVTVSVCVSKSVSVAVLVNMHVLSVNTYMSHFYVSVCVCMLVSPMGWCSQARSQNSSMQLMNRHVFVLHVCVTAPVRTRSWQLQHFLTNIYRSPGFYQVQQVNHFLFQGMAQPCPFSRA